MPAVVEYEDVYASADFIHPRAKQPQEPTFDNKTLANHDSGGIISQLEGLKDADLATMSSVKYLSGHWKNESV